jgi:hypothetical protein
VLTGLVVGYWLHWQRKRMSLVGMLYGATPLPAAAPPRFALPASGVPL